MRACVYACMRVCVRAAVTCHAEQGGDAAAPAIRGKPVARWRFPQAHCCWRSHCQGVLQLTLMWVSEDHHQQALIKTAAIAVDG